jgi:hypothetical protein
VISYRHWRFLRKNHEMAVSGLAYRACVTAVRR